MSYDPKCYELAVHFLPEGVSEEVIQRIAQAIQDCVEDEVRGIHEALKQRRYRA